MTVTDHTVSDVASLLQRSRSSITSLIHTGKLEAYDAAPDGRYRQWRVTPESLQQFRDRNRAKQRPKRRKTVRRPVRQYV